MKKKMSKMKIAGIVLAILMVMGMFNACTEVFKETVDETRVEQEAERQAEQEAKEAEKQAEQEKKAKEKAEREEKAAQDAQKLEGRLALLQLSLDAMVQADEQGVFLDALAEDYDVYFRVDGASWALTDTSMKEVALSAIGYTVDQLRSELDLSLGYTMHFVDQQNNTLGTYYKGKVKVKR